MAKITRFNGNLVAPASASLGTERTLFGDVTQSDDLTDQFTADLLRGWGIVGPSDQPTLQDFNAMGFTLGQIHAYLHQMGVAEYNAAQEYHTGSIANVAGVLYVSLVDTNVGNAPASSPSQWSPQSDHGMIVFDAAGVTAWTVPLAMQLGIIKPKVTVVGGGASGGVDSTSGAGGGGAGGWSIEVIDLTGVTSVTVTVGAAGAAKAGNGDGNPGGSSSFGAFMSATGGSGGLQNGTGGLFGAGAGGSANGGGANGDNHSGAALLARKSGNGGSSLFGGGTAGASGSNSPACAGAGSGGGSSTSGAGSPGIVIIEW